MQQDRLEGWMVRQIENADLTKEAVIQLPVPKNSSQSTRIARPSVATPRKAKSSRRSVAAIAGQEMCSILPTVSPRSAPAANNRDGLPELSHRHKPDEGVEKSWRGQFHDLGQPCIEGNRVDRTKVLHNIKKKQQQGDDERSPLFLWGLPHEHVLDFIRQSVLPASWSHPTTRSVGEWEVVSNEEDDAARVRRAISNVLASAPPKASKKLSSPRAPSPPRSPSKASDNAASPRRGGGTSPRVQSTINTGLISPGPISPRSTRTTPRSDDRIQHFIAELRADPTLWAQFQRDVEQILQQHRLRNHTSDKIQENKEHARTPRTAEEHEQRKKQTEERMDRARRQREQIIQLEDEKLAAKWEAYLRRVNPTRALSAADHERTARYRRHKIWLHVVTFAAISNRWHQRLIQAKHLALMAKVQRTAASMIQRIWRKWKWQHASKHTITVYNWMRKWLWKLLLKTRCRRKAQNATLLQKFMMDYFNASHAKKNFNRVMILWRHKVIRAQKAGMSFVYCTRARMQALSMWWDNVDHDRQRMDRQQSNFDDGRRLTQRKDSVHSNIGSEGRTSAPGSAGRSRRGSSLAIAAMGGVDEKLAAMQMLLTPIEIQRLQQSTIQVVRIPKSIKLRLLTEFLTNARRDFRRKQHAYKEMVLCASYTREVKLEEARAIVQGTMDNTRTLMHSNSAPRIVAPPPCFLLFSDPSGAKAMENLVRRGVELTLEADPELKAIITRQQEHRLQSPHQSPHRPSVTFAGAGAMTATSSSPRNSILKRPTLGNLHSADRPTTPGSPGRATPTPNSTRDTSQR